MRQRAYSSYKPSGTEWLGDIPSHWRAERLKTAARYWVSNVDKVPSDDEKPVRLCNYTDVYYNDRITPDMGLMETTATAEEIERFRLEVGDVVITKDSEDWSDIAIPALVERSAPDLVCGYHLAIIRPTRQVLRGDYLLRALQSSAVNQQFQNAATGVTRYGLPKSAIGEAWIPLPPVSEQQDIGIFLDQQTSRIERLIVQNNRLIERLRERSASLVTRVVTRGLPPEAARSAGLDPYPKFGPSGVEYIGDVPAHWEVCRLRRKAKVIDCKHRTVPFVDDGIPVISIQEVRGLEVDLTNANMTTFEEYEEMIQGDRKPRLGDIVYSRNVTVGDAAIIARESSSCMGQDVCLVRTSTQVPRFLLHTLRSISVREQVEALMIGSTFRRLNVSQIMSLWICCPPIHEQSAIATYLDAHLIRVGSLIRQVERAISRLREHHAALITAAVTGKVDVRKQAA